MEMFAYKAKFTKDDKLDLINGESPPQNFDSFLWAITTVFILITEDTWSPIFYNYNRAVGDLRADLYFISLNIIGPKILLNLFLGILLQNFDENNLELAHDSSKELTQEDLNKMSRIEKTWH